MPERAERVAECCSANVQICDEFVMWTFLPVLWLTRWEMEQLSYQRQIKVQQKHAVEEHAADRAPLSVA